LNWSTTLQLLGRSILTILPDRLVPQPQELQVHEGQKRQPKVANLREKYKDDKETMNKEP
jgi:membrane protein insertase Oxa1/YidC/SpoIIIJ